MYRKLSLAVMAAALVLQVTAVKAATKGLYDGLGYSVFSNFGNGNDNSGQQFNPSESGVPNPLATTDMFDRAGLHISVDANVPVRGDPGHFDLQVGLWVWDNNSFDTTIASTPVALSATTTLRGGFDGWVEVSFPPQSANGTYLIAVIGKGLASTGYWALQRTNSNSGAAHSNAYYPGAAPATDRELAVRLHTYAGTCETDGLHPHVRVTGLSGTTAAADATSAVLTLQGVNLDAIAAARLVRHHENNNSTNPAPPALDVPISGALGGTATNRTVTFNLAAANAEAGAYDLALQTVDACDRIDNANPNPNAFINNNPIDNANAVVMNDAALVSFKNAFVVYRSSLSNFSFENPWDPSLISYGFWPPTCSTADKAANRNVAEGRDWCYCLAQALSVGSPWQRDGDQSTPTTGSCTGTHGYDPKMDGVHYADLKMVKTTGNNRSGRVSVFQTIVPPVTPPAVTGVGISRGFFVTMAYRTAASGIADQAEFRVRDGTDIFWPIANPNLTLPAAVPPATDEDPLPGVFRCTASGTSPVIARSGPLVSQSAMQDVTVYVPAGYAFQSDPPLLTIEYQYDAAPMASTQSSFDNIRITPGCNLVYADADSDSDVDIDDFGVFQACYSPAAITQPPGLPCNCACFDRDGVTGIGEGDLTAFRHCISGPAIPAPVPCPP